MSSLNPDAALYIPICQYPPLPPPCHPLLPYDQSFIYTSTSPPFPYSQLTYSCPHPYPFHSSFRISKQLTRTSDQGFINPRISPLPPQEGPTAPLSQDAARGPQSQISEMQAKEVKEEKVEPKNFRRYCRKPAKWCNGSTSRSNLVDQKRVSWRPKDRSLRKQYLLLSPPKEDFEFKEENEEEEADLRRSTVMIKNLPNKFTKKRLLQLLDAHCLNENKKLQAAAPSEFDFLYLPMDFSSGSNLGYAFVNFTTPKAARRLHLELHKKMWNLFGSRKICEVTYARIQGLDALLNHFKNSSFACETDEYLPVYFTPSRDGLRETEQHYVGNRCSKTGG